MNRRWLARVIATVDDTYVKVARVHGTLAWHTHEREDEAFLVLKGHLSIESTPGEGTKVSISLPIDGPHGAQDTVARVFASALGEEVSHGTLRKTA